MSRFKRIKNKSNKKSSVSIDEKIAALNKQLKKTGMLSEEPTMNTSNIYPEVSEVPNQDLSNFEAIMTGGERLGFSGADGNTAGNASFGDVSGVSGVALSPPHPVTGVRTSAAHIRDGTGSTTPLRPGVTISRGFSDNPPQYTMGSCLWFYDSDFNNGAGQPAGKWCNLEFSNFTGDSNGKWFFWDTIKPPSTLAGLYIANTDLSQHPCGDISDLIDGLNFPNGSLGPPKIPLLTQKGLETEPIYPGPIANLFGLGKRGLDWLKGKAEEFKGNFQSNTEGLGQDLKNHWGETWNDVTGFVEAIIEVGEEMADQAAGLLDGLNNLYAISDVANEAKKNGHITDDNQIKEGEKGSITNPHENFISDGTAKHILRGVDLDGPNMGSQIQDNVSANPLTGGGNWGSKGIHNNLPGKGVNPDQYPSPYKDSEGNFHIPDTYLFAKHGFLPRKYSPTGWDQEKVMGGQNPHVKFTVQGLADLNYYWSKATGSSETEAKQNAQETANGVAAFFDKSIGNILPGTVGPNSPLIHFETIIPKNQIDRILGNRGITNESYISESAKLGHFEPDVLDVDINDIRKGIMPEYPKQPPAKMIDGYHEKSRIKPKEAKNIIPTLKIDKTDLIRNHRIKPSEVDEMMKTINMINDYIKKHPEDFIYAQQRYPVDDPRLAELNWKMDQMLDASKNYLDSNFKVNEKLFKRAMDRTKNNIKVTDPKYVQQHYDELRGTMKSKPPINRKSPSRFFKKPVRKKSSMEEINDKIKKLDKDLLI